MDEHGELQTVKQALKICSKWVKDVAGEIHKDCLHCPYHDENDPAGINCGERLMADAEWWIEELEEF